MQLKLLALVVLVLLLCATVPIAATVSAASQKAPVYVYTDDTFTAAHPSYGNLKPFGEVFGGPGGGTSTFTGSAAEGTFTLSQTNGRVTGATGSLKANSYPNPQTYAALADKPVVVTVKLSYTSSASGPVCYNYIDIMGSIGPYKRVMEQSDPGTVSATKTVTFTGLRFGQVFSPSGTTYVQIYGVCQAYHDSSASLSVTVSQVKFEFV